MPRNRGYGPQGDGLSPYKSHPSGRKMVGPRSHRPIISAGIPDRKALQGPSNKRLGVSGSTTGSGGRKRPGRGTSIQEDHPLWNARTMGNKRGFSPMSSQGFKNSQAGRNAWRPFFGNESGPTVRTGNTYKTLRGRVGSIGPQDFAPARKGRGSRKRRSR